MKQGKYVQDYDFVGVFHVVCKYLVTYDNNQSYSATLHEYLQKGLNWENSGCLKEALKD